jgi:hypothetical protein
LVVQKKLKALSLSTSMRRYVAIAMLYILTAAACTQPQKKLPAFHRMPSEAMIVTQATQERFDSIETLISQQFTPKARQLLAQSRLYGARLKKSAALNGQVPAGVYVQKTGTRLIDRRMFEHDALDEIIFHEIIHRCSKLINRKAFQRTYEALDGREWLIKRKVEHVLLNCYDPKKSDWTAERIAYTLQFWFYHSDVLPVELEKVFSPIIKRDILIASRFVGMRH